MSKSNNPFETGNKRDSDPFENDVKKAKRNNGKRDFKRYDTPPEKEYVNIDFFKIKSGWKPVAVIVILAIVVMKITPLIFLNITNGLYGVESVENYTYSYGDVNEHGNVNPFPQTLTKGENYTIDHSDKRLVTNNNGESISLVVGNDIKPGVYTIETTGSLTIYDHSVIENDFTYPKDIEYYNIPLIEGDTLEIEYPNYLQENEYGSVKLTSQSKYVNFKPGINGIFVYGLNQFDSGVKFDKGSYAELVYGYNDPKDDESYVHQSYNDKDVTLPGSPGSYFAVEYNN